MIPSRNRPPSQLVVYAQNHDHVGNRARGDRLSTVIPHEALKVAAATVLLGPNVPLLFMGEEYAETAPFVLRRPRDPGLVDAVRKGRLAEFASFGWQGEIPDPQSPGRSSARGSRGTARSRPRRPPCSRGTAS
jgi:maltooligosyltrehalose trehalohydrolase